MVDISSLRKAEYSRRPPPPKSFWRDATELQKQFWDKDMFIDYPDVKGTVVDVIYKVNYSATRKVSQGIHIVAESGGGKTTLAKELDRCVTSAFWRDDPETTIVPVLHISAPTPCTPTEMCFSVLETLGDPRARSRTRKDPKESLASITAHYINKCEVRLVLFDNFQDIPTARRARGIEQIGIRLRDLIDMTACTWVFLGTESSRNVINAANQLIKRVPYTKTLHHFSLVGSDAAIFLRLLERMEEWIPLSESNSAQLRELAGQIYIATQGILERIAQLLGQASFSALKNGREILLKEDFKEAFRIVIGPDSPNPFSEDFAPRKLNRKNEPYEFFGSPPKDNTNDK